MKKVFLLTGALSVSLSVALPMYAQTDAARGVQQDTPTTSAPVAIVLPPATLPGDAATLYADAEGYAARKFAEFKRNKVPYNALLESQVNQQQRELATQHAAQLVARGQLQGTDNYYLGLLYVLAGQPETGMPPLRRFLTEPADTNKEFLQRTRLLLGTQAAGVSRFAEAEAMLVAYAQAEPRTPLELFRLHNAISNGYYRAKQLEPAAAHAATAYALVKDPQTKLGDAALRAKLIGNTGIALVQFKLKLKQEAEATALLAELLQLGLTLPAAHVYDAALDLLIEQGHADAAWQAFAASASSAATAPEVAGITDWIDQKPTTLAALRGQVVLLDFWATWCGPCRLTMPKLKTLHERFKDKGLVVIGVTQLYGRVRNAPLTPGEELGYLRQFKKEMRLPYGFAVDPDGANELRYGVRSIPTAVLIDRKGRLRFITVGASDTSADALDKAIKQLLAEQ